MQTEDDASFTHMYSLVYFVKECFRHTLQNICERVLNATVWPETYANIMMLFIILRENKNYFSLHTQAVDIYETLTNFI